MPAIDKGYQVDFKQGINFIGSDIAFGLRSNIISKKEGLFLDFKNELLAGKILHRGFDKKDVIYHMTKDINEELGYEELESNGERFIKLDNENYLKFEALSEKKFIKKYPEKEYIEIEKGKFFRMHPDLYSTLYCIDFKTTSIPKFMWKEIAPYYIMQLNSYLGFNHQEFGFLLRCDVGFTGIDSSRTGFFRSKSKKYPFIWNKYFTLYPHNFNPELFYFTLEKIRNFFYHMDNNTDLAKIPCCEFLFECKDKCRKFCPNPIEEVKMDVNGKCVHCNQEIRAGTKGLMRNNKMYHHTNENGERIEDCIKACKDAYEVIEKKDDHQSIADMMIDNYMSGGLD